MEDLGHLQSLIQTFGWLSALGLFILIKFGPKISGWLEKLGDYYVNKIIASRELNPTKRDILEHRFYSFMDISLKYHIDSIMIENKYKRAVCKDFLKIKFQVALDILTELFSDDSLYELSHHAFQLRIENAIEKIIKTYNEKALNEGIPLVFIEKFSAWHQKTLEMGQTFVKEVCESKWIEGNHRTAYSLQNEFLRVFTLTMVDAERTIEKINGAFVGMTYKGILCIPDSNHH